MSVWQMIQLGGWIMVPLFACSIVVWAICIERLIAFRRWKEKNREFLLAFSNLWLKSEFESLKKLCESSKAELATLGIEMLETKLQNKNQEKLLERLERKRLERNSELKRFLWLLGTIGSAAPFIGLLGTVVGIIRSFQSMAEAGAGGFAVVAAGISEALIATAAGIIVAVVALFFYNYFQTKVSTLQFQLKLLTQELLEVWDTTYGA
ncbi:MAG: MotA/TolQ/ExbB proton channel family protein [Bacteriovoracia bacterium]